VHPHRRNESGTSWGTAVPTDQRRIRSRSDGERHRPSKHPRRGCPQSDKQSNV